MENKTGTVKDLIPEDNRDYSIETIEWMIKNKNPELYKRLKSNENGKSIRDLCEQIPLLSDIDGLSRLYAVWYNSKVLARPYENPNNNRIIDIITTRDIFEPVVKLLENRKNKMGTYINNDMFASFICELATRYVNSELTIQDTEKYDYMGSWKRDDLDKIAKLLVREQICGTPDSHRDKLILPDKGSIPTRCVDRSRGISSISEAERYDSFQYLMGKYSNALFAGFGKSKNMALNDIMDTIPILADIEAVAELYKILIDSKSPFVENDSDDKRMSPEEFTAILRDLEAAQVYYESLPSTLNDSIKLPSFEHYLESLLGDCSIYYHFKNLSNKIEDGNEKLENNHYSRILRSNDNTRTAARELLDGKKELSRKYIEQVISNDDIDYDNLFSELPILCDVYTLFDIYSIVSPLGMSDDEIGEILTNTNSVLDFYFAFWNSFNDVIFDYCGFYRGIPEFIDENETVENIYSNEGYCPNFHIFLRKLIGKTLGIEIKGNPQLSKADDSNGANIEA